MNAGLYECMYMTALVCVGCDWEKERACEHMNEHVRICVCAFDVTRFLDRPHLPSSYFGKRN